MASLYHYRSLMLYRLIRFLPVNLRYGIPILRAFLSGVVIAGYHFPETSFQYASVSLEPERKHILPALKIRYTQEHHKIHSEKKQFDRFFLRTGLIPVKTITTLPGSSIHYAGTLPYSHIPKKYHQRKDGLLYFTKNVYIGDSSGFCFLPAKGLTFTIMANAHRIAKKLIKK